VWAGRRLKLALGCGGRRELQSVLLDDNCHLRKQYALITPLAGPPCLALPLSWTAVVASERISEQMRFTLSNPQGPRNGTQEGRPF
jgi:hypothetical protein